MNGESKAPLAGVRILDLTRVIAGPYCTMQLADLGAEVIKIENPEGGDDSRHAKPPEAGGESHYYLAYNRNKKSVTLDIRTPEGQDILHQLAARSDVLIENFRVGVMKRFGLDYATMKTRHPHLIYLSISAYGQQGSMSYRPGFDPVIQAEFGMMSINGEKEGQPIRHPVAFIDTVTFTHCTAAICTALYARRDTGEGQYIEISLMAAAVATLGHAGSYYLTSGENPPRCGNAHTTATPTNLFETKNGPIYLAAASDRMFGKLCRDVINRPDILEDPRFENRSARSANRDELYTLLDQIFANDTRENWLEKMKNLPAGPVRTIGEALKSREVTEQGMVRTVDHPSAGHLRVIAAPYRFSGTPIVEPEAPPLLGADTEAVLSDLLGYNEAKIAELGENKIIGTASILQTE